MNYVTLERLAMNTPTKLSKLTRSIALTFVLLLSFASLNLSSHAQERGVRIVKNEASRRVDVLVDGQPFTSYVWPETLMVPVLYPLRTSKGTVVTRGFPLEPRAGERVDHPHHAGFWMNYGNVNGVDFWNNSITLPAERRSKMGSVVHQRITRASGGKERGELTIESDWVMPDRKPIIREVTTFVFRGGQNLRVVDRVTTLTALDTQVLFKDDKEGMLGLRVRRELEQPSNEPLVFTDASGQPTTVKVLDNTGVTGLYYSSEGKIGDAVWGTRARWVMLKGDVSKESIALVMLDHPKNVGFPTYWHARGYGLFAANPLGQAIFSNGKEKLDFKLDPKQSVTFRYRLLILSGPTTPEQVETQYQKFVGEVK